MADDFNCPHCGSEIKATFLIAGNTIHCHNCKKECVVPEHADSDTKGRNAATSDSEGRSPTTSEPRSEGPVVALMWIAWLNLFGSLVGGIILLSEYGVMEVPGGYSGTETVANPVGIGVGLGLIAEGILVCAFCLVICTIADNIIAIRKKLAREEDRALKSVRECNVPCAPDN